MNLPVHAGSDRIAIHSVRSPVAAIVGCFGSNAAAVGADAEVVVTMDPLGEAI
jgi:hypothetical protein